jgi:hypothetical protein
MALALARINTSPGPSGRKRCALIAPRFGDSTQKARASSIGGIIPIAAESDARMLVE